MRGNDVWKALRWPTFFALSLTALQAVLYFNGIGWWTVEFCVLAGCLITAVFVIVFLLVSLIKRQWERSARLLLLAVALGGTPFLMGVVAEYAQVARFHLHRDAYEKQVAALPKGSRLVVIPWCKGDCSWSYVALVFDERDMIPLLRPDALPDRAWMKQAEKDPLLGPCVRDPVNIFYQHKRDLGGHFYLYTCNVYYGP
jgi:hypothetical protein